MTSTFSPIPSNTNVYLEPGAVILGGFIVQNAENVTISGHGIITQRGIHRYSSINGIRVSHSRNVRIDGLTFLNPAHYTVHLGGSENIIVRGIRSFSCEGWSDGIDMMSCSNVHIDRCFLRTSDDCIAIYGSRWEYTGNTSDVLVENCTLWADVAHPTNIGTHGDSAPGRRIEHVTFRNIHCDCLQPVSSTIAGYGEMNRVSDVTLENVNVCGKTAEVQVGAYADEIKQL